MVKVTEVVAALIFDGDRFMICRRPENKARGLLWEFVGGKVEKGETHREALVRECREELDVEIEAGEIIAQTVHTYPDIKIRLTLFKSKIKSGEVKLIEHRDIKWITSKEIDNFEFCPADTEILKIIKERF